MLAKIISDIIEPWFGSFNIKSLLRESMCTDYFYFLSYQKERKKEGNIVKTKKIQIYIVVLCLTFNVQK